MTGSQFQQSETIDMDPQEFFGQPLDGHFPDNKENKATRKILCELSSGLLTESSIKTFKINKDQLLSAILAISEIARRLKADQDASSVLNGGGINYDDNHNPGFDLFLPKAAVEAG